MKAKQLPVSVALAMVVSLSASRDLPILDRVIDARLGVDVVRNCTVPSMVAFIARAVRGQSGAEFVPGPCDWDMKTRSGLQTVDLQMQGLTVRQALDQLVTLDRRYKWAEAGGVVTIRPVEAWTDGKNFLNTTTTGFEFSDRNRFGALGALRRLVGVAESGAGEFFGGDTEVEQRRFSVSVQRGTGVDILNAISRSHGEMQWEVTYCDSEPSALNASIKLIVGQRAAAVAMPAKACRDR